MRDESTADFDVIVVGARCAGAALATLLARSGAKVLMLDKDALPSDQVASTHTIHPPGIDVLDELGVGDAIRERAPATRTIRLDKNGAFADLSYSNGRAEYCPRRQRLDGLLQHAAVAAGVELRDRSSVTALTWSDGRVTGVEWRGPSDAATTTARLVVGADGRRSTVAGLVRAEEYLGYEAPRAMYWGYWKAPPFWRSDPAYPFGMYIGHRGNSVHVIFQTDDNQLLLGSAPEVAEAETWRHDPRTALLADLAADPVVAPLVASNNPDGKIRGVIRERYFFRSAAGPGWALVGDAGHHKDFIIGDGITEALLQARDLARAISAEASDRALQRWWRARDVRALPHFFFAQQEGEPGPPPELDHVVFSHLSREPDLRGRMAAVMDHQLSPFEALPVGTVARWMLGAALRGRFSVLPEFLAAGRRASMVSREMAERQKLLDALD